MQKKEKKAQNIHNDKKKQQQWNDRYLRLILIEKPLNSTDTYNKIAWKHATYDENATILK